MPGGVTLTLTGHEQAQAALGRLARSGRDLGPVLRAIGSHLENTTRRRFHTGASPAGASWKQSLRAKQQDGGTLVDTGRLRDSITSRAQGREVQVGTNVLYAAIHQFGGVIRPKNKQALHFPLPGGGFFIGKKVTIPARPFLGLSAADARAIERIVARHLAQQVTA